MLMLSCVVPTASIALALIYFRWLERPASHPRAILKTLPVLLLAIYALILQAPILLIAALALGALGDLFLAYDGESAFLSGLTIFLLSHIAYVALFWPTMEPSLIFSSAWRYAAGWFFVLLAAMTLYILWRPAGRLGLPVSIYGVAIIAMVFSALAQKSFLPAAGASLFILSDTALANRHFLLKPADAMARKLSILVWGSYFAAQLLLTLAVAGLPRF